MSHERDYRNQGFAESLRESLTVISEYGRVIEETANLVLGIPESRLPYSREIIKKSIVLWYKALQDVHFREIVRNEFSELAQHILSERFFNFLGIGYMSIASFIPDEEAELCLNYQLNLLLSLLKQSYDNNATKEDIETMIRSFLNSLYPNRINFRKLEPEEDQRCSEIRDRINKERVVYLQELRKS